MVEKIVGTLCLVKHLPTHAATNVIIAKSADDRRCITVTLTDEARLQVTLQDASSAVLMEATSCPIDNPTNSPVLLLVEWSHPEYIRIRLNATLIGSFPDSEIPNRYTVCDKAAPRKPRDYAIENQNALQKRRKRYEEVEAEVPKGDRVRQSPEYMWQGLRDHVAQMGDLLDLIHSGHKHHVLSVAAINRNLIADKTKKLSLLQHCAARLASPLMLYTVDEPERVLPIDMNVSGIWMMPAASSEPRRPFENPIDLDIWLSCPASGTRHGRLIHRKLIWSIGTSRGSHYDADIQPELAELLKLSGRTGWGYVDMLNHYVITIGHLTRNLANRLLSEKDLLSP